MPRRRGATLRLRRRADAIVERAHALLDVGDAPIDADAIHELRVACKRLRAVWQLLTPVLGRATTRARDHALRDAAKRLAGHREAHVLRRTIERLRRRHAREESEHAALDALAERVAARWPEVRAEPSAAEPLRAAFADQRDAIAALPQALDDDDLLAGLLRSYGRARQEGRRAALLRDDDAWHRCRRWAKYELYQLELLARGDPERSRVRRLTRLGDTLGRFNDLCNLRALADAGRPELAASGAGLGIDRVLGRENRVLRAELERRFVRLYADDEGRRARRVRRWLSRA